MSNSRRDFDSDDFFSDTRMTLGDHIEELRTHLIRAIIGFSVAVGLSLFFGGYVVDFIAAPIDSKLEDFHNRRLEKRAKDEMAKLNLDVQPQLTELKISRKDLENIFDLPVKQKARLSDDKEFVLVTTLRDPKAEIEDWVKHFRTLGPRPGLKSFTIMETALVWFKVCLITGLILGSPWIFYQIWSFIAAGLYPHEKRLVNHFLPFSVLLFLAGVALCQFLVMPQTISGLLVFNEWLGIEPELRLNDWLTFALILPVLFGVAFQTPLAMLTLERVGLMTVESYRAKRSYILFALAILYVIVSPTPDPWTMVLFWVPMAGLYELGIWLCKLAPRRSMFGDEETSDSEEMVEV